MEIVLIKGRGLPDAALAFPFVGTLASDARGKIEKRAVHENQFYVDDDDNMIRCRLMLSSSSK